MWVVTLIDEHMSFARRIVTLILALTGVLWQPAVGRAEPPAPSEYLIKAAFLYNFTRFIDWPAAALTEIAPSLRLCILGEDPFGEALDSIRGKSVKGKELVVERLSSPTNLRRCQVLFISGSERPRLPQVLGAVKDLHVLTVGEMAGFAQAGGVINFVTAENRIRLEINPEAARRAGLAISSKLLSLATVVEDKR